MKRKWFAEAFALGYESGAAVAFGLMGMALAIGETHDPWRYCACGASYLGSDNPVMCFGCAEELTPEWQEWAAKTGIGPRRKAVPSPSDAEKK